MRSKKLTIPSKWIGRISFLYLLIPFLIFCLGFLKTYISLCIIVIFLWLIIKSWSRATQERLSFSLTRSTMVYTILVVFVWVALSGIGGFAFQNTDFHIRNAIFRDLINYHWPVKYFTNPTDSSISYSLTYYIGFWLPAALVGKIAGWTAANIALYFWSVLGIILTIFLLASKIKLSPIENILGGGIILGISLLYFLPNVQSSPSASQVQSVDWVFYVIFVLFEGLILWWIFKARYKANLNWYLAGALLIVIPLIKVGNSIDFCMRASIPTLFMLLLWSAETLSAPKTVVKAGLILLIFIGAITPIYEINRSIYRTANYFLSPPSKAEKFIGEEENIYMPTSIEFDHPYTLTADSYKSLANFDPEQIPDFVVKNDHSLFETYLSK